MAQAMQYIEKNSINEILEHPLLSGGGLKNRG
jgi:hypothetical protein